MQEINRIINIISKSLDICPYDINSDSCFTSMKNWDSLSSLRVITALEEEFGCKIPIYKFIKAKTVNDLINLLEAKK